MRAMLNAMGATLWGAIAITLALAVAVLGHRVSLSYRSEFPTASTRVSSLPGEQPSVAPTGTDAANAAPSPLSRAAVARHGQATDQQGASANPGVTTLQTEPDSTPAALPEEPALIGHYLPPAGPNPQKDCKDSAVWVDKAIAAARKAGEAPKENLYRFKLQCASDAGDMAAMDGILVDLIKLTNKTTYWNTLLRIERQDEREDHNTLMIYRIMYNTNSMQQGSDYIEMAQLLGDAALPADAWAVLDKASSQGLIKDEQKERTGRLAASFKTRADADKKGLPQLDSEASKNPAGEADVKLGEVYYGAGDYQNAVTAINRGLQKGKVKHLDEAYVYLGLSQAQLKNIPEAKKAFGQLKSVPEISQRVLRLWDLYAEKLS
jgi:hypothetical protein